jgi:hypothetical protein
LRRGNGDSGDDDYNFSQSLIQPQARRGSSSTIDTNGVAEMRDADAGCEAELDSVGLIPNNVTKEMVIISEIDDDQDLSDATSFANQESISHGLSGVKCDIRICADSVDDASLDGDEKDASPDGVNNPNDVIDEADVIDPDWFEDDLQFEPSAPKRYPAGDVENTNSDAGPVMVDDASPVPNVIENFNSTSVVKFVKDSSPTAAEKLTENVAAVQSGNGLATSKIHGAADTLALLDFNTMDLIAEESRALEIDLSSHLRGKPEVLRVYVSEGPVCI